jgi:hypothetical protein
MPLYTARIIADIVVQCRDANEALTLMESHIDLGHRYAVERFTLLNRLADLPCNWGGHHEPSVAPPGTAGTIAERMEAERADDHAR